MLLVGSLSTGHMKNQNSHTSLGEKAYQYLRGKILSGQLSPGMALSEASLARELGNSRGPLREAIRRLTGEGFLRQTPSGGSVVVDFSRRDIDELYELREALEVYAVGKAAAHKLQAAELETLAGAVSDVLLLRDELEASGGRQLNADGMRQFIRMDLRFHTMLVRAAANSRILKVVADTRVLLNIFGIWRKGHDVAQLTQIHRYHRDILAAIVRHDPQEATRLLGEHIRLSKEERLKEYDEREREAALGHPLDDLYSVDLS
jgi:DNA-binding GntR family transcriptional regulator